MVTAASKVKDITCLSQSKAYLESLQNIKAGRWGNHFHMNSVAWMHLRVRKARVHQQLHGELFKTFYPWQLLVCKHLSFSLTSDFGEEVNSVDTS